MTQSALGMDGLLSWTQARLVARAAGKPLPFATARLDESHGSLLGDALLAISDEPSADVAEFDGYALCAAGPWTTIDLAPDVALPQHYATKLRAFEPIPPHTDAVLPTSQGQLREIQPGEHQLIAFDSLNGTPDENARPEFGSGIIRQAAIASAGRELVPADSLITPQVISLAAAAGYDHLRICRPPIVSTLIIGASLLEQGTPRGGRVRDALGISIPAFVGALGARGNPHVRAPETRDLLLEEIEDSHADLLITTGSTAPGGENLLRNVLRDLAAHWLIDGITMTPGAQVLLARLPDGKLLLGLPGDPRGALTALLTVAPPLVAGLRGAKWSESTQTAVLIEETPLPEYAEDTAIVPIRVTTSAAGRTAQVLHASGPAGLTGWANATDFAVVPPGMGSPGDVVITLSALGG
jgi:molybdopterin molybdotransferase